MWSPDDVLADLGIDIQRFGPIQATAFTEEPEVPSLNQIQGAAEPGAIEGGYRAEARCHTVFAALGECDAEHFAAASHNLLAAGFREAYRSHNWQRPSLSPAARG